MAKMECRLKGDFNMIVADFDREILGGSVSASLEDSSLFVTDDCKCAVRVYERYSYIGNNRVSLSLTFFEIGEDDIYMSAITSGGSQALFIKINTFGEEAFLDKINDVVKKYIVGEPLR